MLVLNLLPPQEKEKLKEEEIHRWIGFYGTSILAIIFIFISLLLISWSYVLIQLNSVSAGLESARAVFKDQGFSEEENNVKEINSQLQKVDAAQKRQLYYSKFLLQLAAAIPEGASLKSVSISDQTKGSISGFATDRNQVVSIKEKLEKSDYFKNINSPLTNFVEQKNIDFVFFFDINLDLLKND